MAATAVQAAMVQPYRVGVTDEGRSMIRTMLSWCAPALSVWIAGVALAAVPPGEHRARIFVDDKPRGEALFSRRQDEDVRIDEVRSDVSIRLLGFEVFGFTQEIEQRWEDGQLVRLSGRTDDDGDLFVTDIVRENGALVGTLNGQPVELPGEAFPTSVWNYEITQRPILFDVKDLELRHVVVERSKEVIEVGGRAVETERFDFVEGWDATIWYDDQQRLVQFVYGEGSHRVKVVPERCPAKIAAADAGRSVTC